MKRWLPCGSAIYGLGCWEPDDTSRAQGSCSRGACNLGTQSGEGAAQVGSITLKACCWELENAGHAHGSCSRGACNPGI